MGIKVNINELKYDLIIGVHPHEKESPQPIILNLTLEIDIDPNTLQDDLSQTVDYDTLTTALIAELQNTRFELIETLVLYVQKWLLKQPKINHATVEVVKPKALQSAASVSVVVD